MLVWQSAAPTLFALFLALLAIRADVEANDSFSRLWSSALAYRSEIVVAVDPASDAYPMSPAMAEIALPLSNCSIEAESHAKTPAAVAMSVVARVLFHKDFHKILLHAGAYPMASFTWLVIPADIDDEAKRNAMAGFLKLDAGAGPDTSCRSRIPGAAEGSGDLRREGDRKTSLTQPTDPPKFRQIASSQNVKRAEAAPQSRHLHACGLAMRNSAKTIPAQAAEDSRGDRYGGSVGPLRPRLA